MEGLQQVFGDNAQDAASILQLSERSLLLLATLGSNDIGRPLAHWAESYRLNVLNSLAGTHGVEGVRLADGTWLEYLNTGDPYKVTLCYLRGQYVVRDWGSIIEEESAWNDS